MMRRNLAATSLKIVCKNLNLVKCYDKTNMKDFALSLWKKKSAGAELILASLDGTAPLHP